MAFEVWTVADDEVVATDGSEVLVLDGLEPGTEVDVPGVGPVRTLERPPGERLATVCTVNDVHFGEVECGRIESMPGIGPVLTTPPGEEPYPEMMSGVACAAIAEVAGRSGTPWGCSPPRPWPGPSGAGPWSAASTPAMRPGGLGDRCLAIHRRLVDSGT